MKLAINQRAIGSREKGKLIHFVVSAMFVAFGFAAEAQQPKKLPRIGLIVATAMLTALRSFSRGCENWVI